MVLCLVAAARAQVPEVLYLKFNEGGGVTTADESLVGLPGFSATLSSTATSSIWNSTTARLGNSCYRRTGSGALWQFNSSVALSGDWTIELWFLADPLAGNTALSPFGDGSSGGFSFRSSLGLQGDIELDSHDLGFETSYGTVVFNDALVYDTWVHLAIVCDTATQTLTPYIDGVPRPSMFFSGSTDLAGTDPSKFGTHNWLGSIDEIRIWNHARTASQILADKDQELSAASNDLIVSAITSPAYLPRSYNFPGSNEVVSCEIENVGTNTIPAGTVLSLVFDVNGGPPQAESLTLISALVPGGRHIHTFATTADVSGVGTQTVHVTVSWPLDQRPGNNSRDRVIGGSRGDLITEYPWSESFDDTPRDSKNLPLHWFQEPELVATIDLDWIGDEYSGVGVSDPPGRFAAGGAAVINGQSIGTSVRSPTFDLRGLMNPRVRFWANNDVQSSLFGFASLFSLDVIEYPAMIETVDVFGPVGDLGSEWVEVQVDLSAFAGKVVDLQFELENASSSVSGSLFCMDEVLVYDHQIGSGQAPQAGLAEFEINDSRNVGMNAISHGEPGPYYESAAPGETLNFSFRGAPAQPILLVFGPLNPIAATFPLIGQLDIGGPVDPSTGIPSNLQILFDGNQPGGLNGLFVTGPSGVMNFVTPMPMLPPGVLTTFQPVLRDPTTGMLVIANAVQLEVQ